MLREVTFCDQFTSLKMWLPVTSPAPCFIGWNLPVQGDTQSAGAWTLLWVCRGEGKTTALPPRPVQSMAFSLGTQKYHSALTNVTCLSCLSEQSSTQFTCSKCSEQAPQDNLLEIWALHCCENTQCKFLKADWQDLLTWGVTFRINKLCKFKL